MATLSMAHEIQNYLPDVAANQRRLREALKNRGIDVLVVSAADSFLSEYTLLADNERFALTGFSGSTGDGVFVSEELQSRLGMQAPFRLMVDGRYHLQVDGEVSPSSVEVDKLPMEISPSVAPLRWLEERVVPLGGRVRVALDGSRNTFGRLCALRSLCERHGWELVVLGSDDVSGPLALPGRSMRRPIRALPERFSGRSLPSTLHALFRRYPEGLAPEEVCLVTCAADDAAFLLNARGYHSPHSAGVLAWTFTLGARVVVFLPEGVHEAPVELGGTAVRVDVVRRDVAELEALLREVGTVKAVAFSSGSTNAWLPNFVQGVWPKARLIDDFNHLSDLRAAKTPEECASMRDSFLAASRAIARTLRWLRESASLPPGSKTSDPEFAAPLSETFVAAKIAKEYAAEGALDLSFTTIAAADENGAVIHYKDNSPHKLLKAGSLFLLDSGAVFAQGFATDCTRVAYCPGVPPADWQKRIYTVCLKGFVAGMRAVLPKHAPGRDLDAAARKVMVAQGFDFGHGLGHGIGIHVHESGHGARPAATRPLVENGALSIEPGIYLPGQGGVRIENVVIAREHPERRDHFHFENLLWVGFDWDLIDVALLDEGERAWLVAYERRCAELGTAVTSCPL